MFSWKSSLAVLFSAGLILTLAAADNIRIDLGLDKKDGVYKKGDEVVLKVQYFLNRKAAAGPVSITVVREDGSRTSTVFAAAPKEFRYKALKSPSHIQFIVTALDKENKPVKIANSKKGKTISATIGAIVDPQEYRPGLQEPADFRKFWDDTLAELAKVPVKELERKEMKVTDDMLKTAPDYFAFRIPPKMPAPKALAGKFKSYDVKVACVGAPVSGYLTMPANAAPKSLPAIVSFHGAPGGSARQAFAEGVIRFDVNPHGMENGHPREYYKKLFETTHRAYQFRMSRSRDKFYFRGMFMRVKRALDYVKSLPEYDGKTLIVVGNSQGGAQSLVAAGLDPDVKLVYASVPAMCDHGGVLVNRVSGWPKLIAVRKGKPVRPAVVTAVAYYDAAFFAKRIKAEAYLTTGLIDKVCSSTSVFCAYNNIPGKKHITTMPRHGHSRTYSPEFNKRLLEVIREAGQKK